MRAELENPSLQTDLQNKGTWYVNTDSGMLFFFEGFSDSESKAEREWEEHQKVINRCKKCKSSVSKGRLRRKEYFGMSATQKKAGKEEITILIPAAHGSLDFI